MTLELSSSPGKPEIKTWFDSIVHLRGDDCEIEIEMRDFMAAAYYVLTNNELTTNDPRLRFVQVVKRMQPSPSGKQFLYRDKESSMTEDIFFWTRHGLHGYLSNFWRSPIEVDEEVWPTVEHYYQAMKTEDPKEREMVRKLETPTAAKLAGYHLALRRDWEGVKEEYMLRGLRAKFTQYPRLNKFLLATEGAQLHEDSPWDKYWGYAHGEGKDRLGKLLMQVREELQKKEKNDEQAKS